MQSVPSMFVVSEMQQILGPFIARERYGAFQGEQESLAVRLHFTPYADE